MKLGIIARADPRGLGVQSRDVVAALQPDRVLVVVAPPDPAGVVWPQPLGWFTGRNATVVEWDGHRLDERAVRRWLDGLDVAWSAETFYDWRLPGWARSVGCVPVLHANPELLHPTARRQPIVWWAPTGWLAATLPGRVRVVPMPTPVDAPTAAPEPRAGPVRMVHVAGNRAHADRNGTDALAEAWVALRRRRLPEPELTVFVQSGQRPRFPAGVDVVAGPADRWRMYEGADVLLMPRRFGGLSLPAVEAAACGLAVSMPAVPPNDEMPGPRFPARLTDRTATLGGVVPLAGWRPDVLAGHVASLADRATVDRWRAACYAWADGRRWEQMRPVWIEALEAAAADGAAAGPPARRTALVDRRGRRVRR